MADLASTVLFFTLKEILFLCKYKLQIYFVRFFRNNFDLILIPAKRPVEVDMRPFPLKFEPIAMNLNSKKINLDRVKKVNSFCNIS